MSFEWNLSSSSEGEEEEEEDLESWTRRQGFLPSGLGPSRTDSCADQTTNDDDENEEEEDYSKQQESFSMNNVFAENDDEEEEDEDDDNDDEVDWEDAYEEEEETSSNNNNNNSQAKISQQPSLQPVTIQLGAFENDKNGSSQENNNKKRKRKRQRRRQSFRFETLAPSVQALLQNLHNAHLLTLTSRAVGLSATASDPDVLAVAHSLVPLAFVTTTNTTTATTTSAMHYHQQQQQQLPTLQQVQAFYSWYIDFVHGVEERRARQRHANWAAGAPRERQQGRRRQQQLRSVMDSADTATNTSGGGVKASPTTTTTLDWKTQVLDFCNYLSQSNEQDPQLQPLLLNTVTTQKTTLVPLLFLAMVRSLGWRARFVQAMDIMPLDLNIHHPILTTSHRGTGRGGLFWTQRATAAARQAAVSRTTTASAAAAASTTTKNSRSQKTNPTNSTELALSSATSLCITNWIEVSCMAAGPKAPLGKAVLTTAKSTKVPAEANQKKPAKRRWIYVDPMHQQFNQPHQVELLWKQQQQEQTVFSTVAAASEETATSNNANNRRQKSRRGSNTSLSKKSRNNTQAQQRQAVAYVLAVEHASVLPSEADTTTATTTMTTALSPLQYMRVTDVTPRYAASWIASLRLRGLVRDKRSLQRKKKTAARNRKKGVSQSLQHHDHLNMADTWWSKTLHKLNQYSKDYHKDQELQLHGTTPETAICLDMDDEDDDNDGDKKPAAIDPSNLNQKLQHTLHHEDEEEAQELQASAANEAIPTSKAAFQTHPLYVIPSVLGVAEVLAPDAKKRICGVFKGELVYKRTDVSTALPARKWPYQGHKVKKGEKPVKIVKARKKATPKTFRALSSYGVGASNDGSEERRAQDIALAETALEDGMTEPLFAIWQTEPWSPAVVGPNDPIPVNEYKNVELELLNPGLVHINIRGAAKVAKKLSIPYAPCLLGFEGHGGNRTPTIQGIVVHQHNAEMIREALTEVTHFQAANEHENRRKAIMLKWKKLMVGLLTKERLEREYGGNDTVAR